MDFSKEGVLCKAKSTVSTVCEIVMWVSGLSSPMQTPKEFPSHYYLPLGLRALICSTDRETTHNMKYRSCIVHSYMISSLSSASSSLSSASSSSSSWLSKSLSRSWSFSSSTSSSIMDHDLIGTESGVYLSSNEDIIKEELEKIKPYKSIRSKRNRREPKREYPPPIPLLARTGNLPGRMPWTLTRQYIDGRLILREQRVKRHEYFEAHRSNGRLVLKLISLDDAVRCCHDVTEEDEKMEQEDLHFTEEEKETDGNTEEEKIAKNVETDQADDDGSKYNVKASDNDDDEEDVNGKQLQHKVVDQSHDQTVQKGSVKILASSMPKSCLGNGKERDGDVRKCFPYMGTSISESNFFGMPIPMKRPLHT